MAFVTNLYLDPQCKNSQYTMSVGVAGITGYWADESHWTIGTTDRNGNKIRYAFINQNFSSGIVLSGGSILFNFDDTTDDKINSFFNNPFSTDRISNSSQNAYNNVLFYGVDGNITNYIHFARGGLVRQINVKLGAYHQTPENGSFSERTAWNYEYTTAQGYTPTGNISAQFAGSTKFGCVKMYTITLFEIEHILFAFGVDFSGNISPNAGAWPPTFIIVPVSMFQDKPNKPYVGPVSKESAESAFIGSRNKDNISPRDISITPNPYGFNSNGVYLCDVSSSEYFRIIGQLYNGFSGNVLNMLGQTISYTVGGNSRRPRDEIQTMIDGILCCHYVPVLGGYPQTGTVDMTEITGYSMFNTGSMVLKTVNPLQQETITTGIIPRQTGNYLDFAPYTSCILTIPILGDLEIDTSALLGNSLSLHFGIDLYSGVLSCDVCINDTGGGSWIYATLQGNCACDMPIAGAGAQGNPLLKIAGGLSSIATGGTAKIPAAAFQIYDGLQSAAYSTPIKRTGNTNAGILISPYKIYLTVTTPNNSNAADFWELAGIPSHMSGNVGGFHGYTVFEHVDLSGVSGATESELREIESVLYGGVWL